MKMTQTCHCEQSEAISNVTMSVLLEVAIAAVATFPRNDKGKIIERFSQ